MENELLKPSQLDSMLRYPNGRSARLAKAGLIPHIELPDKEIRFSANEIKAWLEAGCPNRATWNSWQSGGDQ